MISFMLLAATPAAFRTFMVNRGMVTIEGGELRGVREGIEVARDLPPSTLPGFEGWRVYMVKLVREALADETAGEPQTAEDGSPRLIWTRTRLGKWIATNSTAQTIVAPDGRTFRGRLVGTTILLLREDDGAQLGVWQ